MQNPAEIMLQKKRVHPEHKSKIHPRNKHRERYDFEALTATCPELSPFVRPNPYGDESIDFFDPQAVKMLNKALLKHFYGIINWDIPQGYLCPPIPGRADYIHHIADLLASSNQGRIPTGETIRCLDVGVGANCVYPIIGIKEYGWSFVGSDIDSAAIDSAQKIAENNSILKKQLEIRRQTNPRNIFEGVLKPGERFDVVVCNPPFHASHADAQAGSLRKLSNLTGKKQLKPNLNFGGQNSELWCEGGEEQFVGNMVRESRRFSDSCFWFTSLVSKESNLKSIYNGLRKVGAVQVKTLEMGQGNKISRIVAWTFQNEAQRRGWVGERWAL